MDSYGREWAAGIMGQVKQSMYQMDEVIRLCLVALYTGGHVLLEANPGLGKTALVRSLSEALDMSFGRIQFTPDLMPSDITGTEMPVDGEGASHLEFRSGPVFASLILADEINRATPKTQSAMLEAMAEQQVTVLRKTYRLPTPFMVMATQNPIDQEGTFNLPEAQLDRFMFKVLVKLPGPKALADIMDKSARLGKQAATPGSRQTSAEAEGRFQDLRERIMAVSPLPALQEHIANLVLATNGRWGDLSSGVDDQKKTLQALQEFITYGLGPRAAIALFLGAKAWAYLFDVGTDHADGPAFARVAVHALRHRIKLDYGWEDRYQGGPGRNEGRKEGILECFLRDLCVATAPKGTYRKSVQDELGRVLAEQGWQ